MGYGLKKIDWYIIRKFIMTFFIALLLIIGIVIIFDISEKINHSSRIMPLFTTSSSTTI